MRSLQVFLLVFGLLHLLPVSAESYVSKNVNSIISYAYCNSTKTNKYMIILFSYPNRQITTYGYSKETNALSEIPKKAVLLLGEQKGDQFIESALFSTNAVVSEPSPISNGNLDTMKALVTAEGQWGELGSVKYDHGSDRAELVNDFEGTVEPFSCALNAANTKEVRDYLAGVFYRHTARLGLTEPANVAAKQAANNGLLQALLDSFNSQQSQADLFAVLESDGYSCVAYGRQTPLTDKNLPEQFNGQREFSYMPYIPQKYLSSQDGYCWKGKASVGMKRDSDVLRPMSLSKDKLNVSFDEFFDKKSKQDVFRMRVSCELGNFCANSLDQFVRNFEQQTGLSAQLKLNRERVNSTMQGTYAGSTAKGLTFRLVYEPTRKRTYVELRDQPFETLLSQVNAQRQQDNMMNSRGPGSVYKPKSVSASTFRKEIELACFRTVNCKDHQDVLRKMRLAWMSTNASPDLAAREYAKLCLSAITRVQNFGSALRNAGTYDPQLAPCNAAMYEHFVTN